MLSAYHKVCDLINITDGANQTLLHKYISFTFVYQTTETNKPEYLISFLFIHRAALFDHFELSEYLISQV